jgi:S1-C subfamily serine protease
VVRALKLIQQDQQVSRGTIQSHWIHRPFDEVRRLGLSQETENQIRKAFPEEIGMLVAETILPGSQSYDSLKEGDVLVRVNNKWITKFVPLENILDDCVDKEITLEIERGGELLKVNVPVQNLHSITPDRYLEVGGAKLNNVSYQLARYFGVAVAGVYVSEASGMFRLDTCAPQGWIISSIDGISVSSIEDMIPILQTIPDHERVPVTYYAISDVHTSYMTIVTVDKHWSPFRLAIRNDTTGLWDFKNLNVKNGNPTNLSTAKAVMPDYGLQGMVGQLMHSIVKVSCRLPVLLDGYPKSRRAACGLIVDADTGLVLVSRAIVPFDLADVTITIWDDVQIPASVVFIHPTQNYTIVQYDNRRVSAPLCSAILESDPKAVKPGTKLEFLAFTHHMRPLHSSITVTDVALMSVPCSTEPRPRAFNFEAITLDSPLGASCPSGVLAHPKTGKIMGIWAPFMGEFNRSALKDVEYYMGILSSDVSPVVAKVCAGVKREMPSQLPSIGKTLMPYPIPGLSLATLNVEFVQVSLVQARDMGVPDKWIERFQKDKRRHILQVRRIAVPCQGEPELAVRELDLVLGMNGEIISSIIDVNRIVEEASSSTISGSPHGSVAMEVVRAKQPPQTLIVSLSPADLGTARYVVWCGALIHAPHAAVRQQCRDLPSEVYVSGRLRGSPATMFGMAATMFITHIGGIPTPTVDQFLETVRMQPSDAYVRVRMVSFDYVPAVISVKPNDHYFPTIEMCRDRSVPYGWRTVRHGSTNDGVDCICMEDLYSQ